MAKQTTLSDISLVGTQETAKPTNGNQIRNIAVIGFGTMGQGIAQTVSEKALNVTIFEESKAALERGMKELEESLDREIAR